MCTALTILSVCACERVNHLCGANGRKISFWKKKHFNEGKEKNSFKVQRHRARSEMRDDIYANCAGLMKYSLSHSPFSHSLSIHRSISSCHARHPQFSFDTHRRERKFFQYFSTTYFLIVKRYKTWKFVLNIVMFFFHVTWMVHVTDGSN